MEMNPEMVEGLKTILTQYDERLSALETSVNDVILASMTDIEDERVYEEGLNSFTEKYPDIDKLSPYLRALKGDDEYDAFKHVYDSSLKHAEDEGYDEAAFVQNTIDDIIESLEAVKAVNAEGASEEMTEDAIGKDDEPLDKAEIVVETEEEGKDSDDFPSEEELAKELAEAL